MANSHLLPNTCQIPNILLDEIMPKVSHAEFKIIMAVARKTYGWRKLSDRISLSQLIKMTGVSKQKVIDSVKSLSWILSAYKLPTGEVEYSINIDAKTGLRTVTGVVQPVDRGSLASRQGVPTEWTGGSLASRQGVVQPVDTQNPIKPTNTKPTIKTPSIEGFQEFWLAYPKKKSKGDAEKAWKTLNPSSNLQTEILQAVEAAKASSEWRKERRQFIPYPATWLRARGWEDETTQEEEWEPPEVREAKKMGGAA